MKKLMGHKVIRYDIILFISVISVILFSAAPNSFGTHVHHEDDGTYAESPVYLDPNTSIILTPTCTDSDSDKLCNTWELYSGLQISYGGKTYFYGCSTYGPDPVCPRTNSKDIYVEIDYMKAHAPDSAALQAVIGSFSQNGANTLHLQVNEEMKDASGDGYHKPTINTPIDTQTSTEFDTLKKGFFGEPSYRQGDLAPPYNEYLTAKRQAFHYAMFIHSQTADQGVSGKAEFKGNDLIVSLGNFNNEVGSTAQQAGTFMHELGHNLGLRHGGQDDIDCKPNYLSVMNHAYQFSATPNYARNPATPPVIQTPLDEGQLNENIGIGDGGQGNTIVWSGGAYTVPIGSNSINWDGGPGINPVAVDLNNISSLGCSSTGTSLVASNDWGLLYYNVRGNVNNFFLDGTAVEVDSDNKTIAEIDLPEGESIPDELNNQAITNMLLERIHSISDVLESSKMSYSQASLEQKIKNNELEQALKDLQELPQDEKIQYIIELLESATKHSDPITGNYEKYYNKNGILSGPTKQVSNGIPLTDEICKPDYRMVRLDKDHSKDTQSEATCIKYDSILTFIKLKKDSVVADSGLCDGFFNQRKAFGDNRGFFDNLVNASSTDDSKLDCSKYFAQYDS